MTTQRPGGRSSPEDAPFEDAPIEDAPIEDASFEDASFEDASFETVADLLDYPMVVVTTAAGGAQAGCLVGFTSQLSINPPRFLVGLSNKNHTFRIADQATHLVVHLLGREHGEVARLFGEQTGDETDKFAQCSWRPGPGGAPILDQVAGWFSGRILERIAIGDHVGFLLEPSGGQVRAAGGSVITLNDVRDLHPGHEP
jgi:flavin reductase (DIM6/NTAB) family NADH-FMN oxidoreductase RutF